MVTLFKVIWPKVICHNAFGHLAYFLQPNVLGIWLIGLRYLVTQAQGHLAYYIWSCGLIVSSEKSRVSVNWLKGFLSCK